jgi:hypothetical protein
LEGECRYYSKVLTYTSHSSEDVGT